MNTATATTAALPLLRPAPFPRSYRPRPLMEVLICAGFPSPADDHAERAIDLNEEIIRNEPATFFYRAIGRSGENNFMRDGDVVVVDRSIPPKSGDVVLATIDGESCFKIFRCTGGGQVRLESANAEFPDILVGAESELIIEGVVTWTLHRQCRR